MHTQRATLFVVASLGLATIRCVESTCMIRDMQVRYVGTLKHRLYIDLTRG